MSNNVSSSSGSVTHSEPIPINTATSNHHARPRSASDASSEDSEPPLSPTSESPSSIPSVETPNSSNTRVPLSPVSPSSPILSYFYGSPKTPFSGFSTSNKVFEDEDSPDPPSTTGNMHGRRVSTSWIPPVRFAQPNMPSTESQQERGAGVLRRLSLSGGLSRDLQPNVQGRSQTPPNSPDGRTAPDRRSTPRVPGRQKAATLSAGTVDANRVPRAPSPMGERILKGFFDGF